MFSSLGRIYDFENPSFLETNRTGLITKEQKMILFSQAIGWLSLDNFGRGVKYLFIVPFLAIFLAVLLLAIAVDLLIAGISMVGVMLVFVLLLLNRWAKLGSFQ